MPHHHKKSTPGKILFRAFAGIVLLLLLIGAAAAWYVAPVNKLDLSYDRVDFDPKLLQMVRDRSPVLTLTEDELNNLFKKGLNDYLSEHPSSFVRITGARFRQSGDRLAADINGLAGPVPFGAEVGMIMEASPESGGTITLRHDYTSIRNRKVPKGVLSFPPISVRLREHMPFMVEVRKIELLESGMRVSFAVDWSNLLRSLMKLK
ncbi:hypothetical protein [Paenibacillus zanthoxyli]|uniref:hypothetical protein n=1 Tax=Paenibacillus zanthoxyli TaxID=369399 RepID=UPI00047041B2|nr:hypothetical protein [Paenibacillus zanthoxyli]